MSYRPSLTVLIDTKLYYHDGILIYLCRTQIIQCGTPRYIRQFN